MREERENENGRAFSGPNEGGKKEKFLWAEKGKWVNDPRQSKVVRKKKGEEDLAT